MSHGNYLHALDEKGRVSIPKEIRAELVSGLESSVMVTSYYEGCLKAFPIEKWKQMVAVIDQEDFRSLESRQRERLLIGGAHRCPVDNAGRILIPEALRAYAGLKREVVILGGTKGFEIWDFGHYKKMHENLVRKETDANAGE